MLHLYFFLGSSLKGYFNWTSQIWSINEVYLKCRIQLIFLKCHRENLSFGNFGWINIAQQIFSVTENKFIVWNYRFSDPTSIYLFEFSNINNRIKCKICLKLTTEVTDVILVLSITNFEYIWHSVLVCFCWLWRFKWQMEYFIGLN